ncbi:MAG: calcium-binding protein [Dolichospermum sp. UKL201]|nr:MAG: calcium-binding protein [Dolichospermum sp. UKL201]
MLSSNAGANLLKGGAGNDTYYISPQTSGGTVIEDSQGIDSLILNQITLSLSNLKREGTSLIIDLNQDNQFQSTNDLTLRNFFGSSVPGIGFIETVNNLLGSNILSEFNNLILDGTSKNDLLTGKQGDDTLSGKEGDDTLNGGAGNDTMIGGLGNDTYIVDSAGDIVTETSTVATEVDTVQSSVSYVLGVNLENLILTGSAVINGTGNSLNNTITGNAANNIFNGGAGNDTMIGGLGNDTYIVDSAGDIVTETSTVATEVDTVQSSVSYVLGANLENLILTGSAVINGTGNSLNNAITGNAANNILNGGAGNDIMIGGLGNDTYIVDIAGDIVTETSTVATEVDTVQSSVSYVLGANLENLILTGSAVINGTGNSLNNAITGNAANNILNGGAGKDIMIGGLGRDTFVYQNLTDSVLSNFDVITDFNATTGNDLFRVATTPTGFVNVGAVNTLDPAGIGAKLTGAVFGSNFAAQFSFGQRTFVAINNAIAGFNPDADSIIEVTGLTGILTTANFTI